MYAQNFWVDIENSNGAKYGPGPLRARSFTFKKLLSASGEFSFEASGADPNLAALVEKRTAICRYINEDGSVVTLGGGVIDKITAVKEEAGALVFKVSGNDLCRELNYRSVSSLKLASGAAGVTNGPAQIMALAPAGWTLTDGTTITPVYAGFDGESVLNALCKVTEHIGEHWRLGSGRVITWLGPASGFASSGVRAVQHTNDPIASEGQTEIAIISHLEELTDATDIITRIIPRGSGNGGAITTLAAATDSAPAGYTLDKVNNYLKYDTGETAYGRIEQVIDFKGLGPLSNTTADVVSAANALLQAALVYLDQHKAPAKSYTVDLAFVNQVLEPGTTLHVVYRELQDGVVKYDLDDVFNILSVTQVLDETGLHTTQITISTIDRQPASDSSYLAGQAQSGKVLAAHQQLGASVDNLSWRDEMDKDHASSLRFWLGNEYTIVQQAVLRFRIQKLRSTVKAVGTLSATTSEDGGHSHGTTIPPATPNVSIGWYGGTGLATPVSLDANTYVMMTGAGGEHTHTVLPVIATTYGIYEEISGNTLGLGDLAIKLNGGSDLAGSVADIGNGWYALDISAGLVSSIFRPVHENNEIVISTATVDKTARIEAQLTIRGVVQAVAYS